MIIANELRIGNLYIRKHGKGHTETKIDEVLLAEIFGQTMEYSLNEFDPIPLTEKWLVDFGFTEKNAIFTIDDWCFYIEKHDGNWCLIMIKDNFFIKMIKYVHELQNIYSALKDSELIC